MDEHDPFLPLLHVNVARALKDLTSWCHHPDPHPLSVDWRESVKANIADCVRPAIKAVQKLGDHETERLLREAQSCAYELAALLCERPGLSTVPCDAWQMQCDRDLVDDVSRITREILEKADREKADRDSHAVNGAAIQDRGTDKKTGGTSDDGSITWSALKGPTQWGLIFGISATTFKRWVKNGTIKAKKHSSKAYSVDSKIIPHDTNRRGFGAEKPKAK